MKNKVRIAAGASSVVAVTFIYYLASPFIAINSLRNAVTSKNAEEANKYIDYPALRENLKAELTANAIREMQSNPEMASNPFNGLAFAIVGPMINAMVDNYVTPSGMKTIMSLSSNPSSTSDSTSRNLAEQISNANKILKDTSMSYDGLDKFQVSYKNENGSKGAFIFSRKGFAAWSLTNIDINK